MMNRLSKAAALLVLGAVWQACALNYSDLEALGVSCPERDSCVYMNHAMPDFVDKNCECDKDCSLYQDCCIDSARVRSRNRAMLTRRQSMSCLPFGGYQHTGAYMVNRCRSDYNGSAAVKRKCERGGDYTDPLMTAPATDAANRITYSNRYCAECNGAFAEHLTSWVIRISCESLVQLHNVSEDNIISNLRYEFGDWGVNYRDPALGEEEFFACEVLYDVPAYISDDVRLCRHGAVSTCPMSWRRVTVKRRCEVYTAVVYHGDTAYRNPHCAVCNGASVDTLACALGIASRKKQPMSFALLLDVNRSDGDVVGMTRQTTPSCGRNQTYDPFSKRCRSLVCALPGFTMVNGRCVRN